MQRRSQERAARTALRRRAIAAAVLAIALVAVAVGPNTPARASEASSSREKARAEATARSFLNAYGAFEADRAMALLAKPAVEAEWGSPDKFRLELSLLQASGWQQTIQDPTMPAPPPGSDGCDAYDEATYNEEPSGRLIVYCTYSYHQLGSDALRRGPYTDAYWAFVVDNGRIVSAENRIDTKRSTFEQQMWQPFRRWVSSAYPEDAAVMFRGEHGKKWHRSAASVRLWRQHREESVAAGASYVDRVAAICTAAHDRLTGIVGSPPVDEPLDAYFQAYNPVAARVLEETLTGLRMVPPPEPVRPDFEYAYSLGDRLVRQLRGEVGPQGVIHELGALGLRECTFDLPR